MINVPDYLLSSIEPDAVKVFLKSNGFVLTGSKEGIAEAYASKEETVIVPLVKDAREYPHLLTSLLMYLSNYLNLTVQDILGLIVNPFYDILRYRIQNEESRYGQLSVEEAKIATSGLYQVFYSSAQSVAKFKKRLKVKDSANAYAGACRFGQTEYGSYVLKVYCPTTSLDLASESVEPYCREVTRGIVENFMFLSQCDVENPEEPLPPAMSKHVALSIKEMYPRLPLLFTGGLAVRYSPLQAENLLSISEGVVIQEVEFKSNLFKQADIIYQRYCKAEEFDRELLTGYITDLHKDPPVQGDSLENEISHRVSIDLQYGNSRRKVMTKLLPSEYKKAIAWHDLETEIVLDAVIDKRSKKWVVHELFDLSPRDKSQNLLFEL